MIDLTRMDHVKQIQGEMRQVFETPSGQEVMKFLEQICGWYDFTREDPDAIMVAHGKRQVLASIKTLLDLPADQIVMIAKQKE
jgi:hypothetical protein